MRRTTVGVRARVMAGCITMLGVLTAGCGGATLEGTYGNCTEAEGAEITLASDGAAVIRDSLGSTATGRYSVDGDLVTVESDVHSGDYVYSASEGTLTGGWGTCRR
jgi:hypothetical protein